MERPAANAVMGQHPTVVLHRDLNLSPPVGVAAGMIPSYARSTRPVRVPIVPQL